MPEHLPRRHEHIEDESQHNDKDQRLEPSRDVNEGNFRKDDHQRQHPDRDQITDGIVDDEE